MQLRAFFTSLTGLASTLLASAALAAPLSTPLYTTTGVNLLGEVNASEYTVDLEFSLDSTSYWRKIVDFQNRADDAGLYINDDQVVFATSSTDLVYGGFTGALFGTRLTLTRDASGLVSTYVNGALRFSFLDSGNTAVFTAPGGQTSAWLMADDVQWGGNEQASGWLNSVRIYGRALNATEVAAVPEPQTLALAGVGLLTLGALRRRQKKAD